MKSAFRFLLLVTLGLLVAGSTLLADSPRSRTTLDFDWRFHLGDINDAFLPAFNDTKWSKIDVPHDWSIAGPFMESNKSGKAGGFAPLGVGWYRRSFVLPSPSTNKQVFIEFDGVFAIADVWLNGHKVGHNESGYSGFQCDLTAHAKFGGTNVLAVRVENPRPMSRWYTGSGIYRHAWLETVNALRVARRGTYITTSNITSTAADVFIQTTVANKGASISDFDVVTKILDESGRVVAKTSLRTNLAPASQLGINQTLQLAAPRLWSTESPYLYRAITEIRHNKNIADVYETRFGVRSIKFDSQQGFLLNGTKVVLKGVCIHHDNGALGAASFDQAIERRIKILKSMGCNAVRLSHNPHSPELLDYCDRLGLLVIDEAFDKWSGFTPDGTGWREELQDFLRRDRNHPSVVLWSVGNEVKVQLKPEGNALMKSMAEFVHQFEPTRPVTCALHPGRLPSLELPEMAKAMDIVSMNYSTQLYEDDRHTHSNVVIVGSETLPFYTLNQRRTNDVEKFIPGNSWFAVKDYVAGQFIWAGIDYFGESPAWPSKGWPLGLIDTCGFRKDFSYYQQSLYSDDPMVRIAVYDPNGQEEPGKKGWGWPQVASHWDWPARNQTLKVATYANAPVVELLLNGKSLGEKQLADFPDRIITWQVANQPGELEARGKNNGAIVAHHTLRTASSPAKILLLPDQKIVRANGQDLLHLEFNLVDAQNTLVRDANRLITVDVSGPAKVVGIDNGDLSSNESYQGNRRTTRAGKCLAILRTTREPGSIHVTARADGLPEAEIMIESVQPNEKQVTRGPGRRILTNTSVWSPDGQWIVYDTRSDAAGEQFDGERIEMVNVESGEIREVYRSKNGANCGVATFHPTTNQVAFILGPEHPTPDWQYGPYHRQGVIAALNPSGATTLANLDARDLTPPFTAGALRGGSHVHVWDAAGDWVSFTYEDHVMAQFNQASATNEINLRNIGVSVPMHPVKVSRGHLRNHDGDYFSVLVTRTTANPRPGSDEIKKAFEEGWIGTSGYVRKDGNRQKHAFAFQGHVVTSSGETISEVFVVDLPDDLTVPGAGPLCGTEFRLPSPPRGCDQRRLTYTADRKFPGVQGPRHWLRSSPDGSCIAFLMKDDAGVVQLWTISPNGGQPVQVTHNAQSISSASTWSPDGKLIAHTMDNSVRVTDMKSGNTKRLTVRTDDASSPRPEACVFSPDGKQIAFVRRISDSNQIFVVQVSEN